MKVRKMLRDSCPDGINCPRIYELDDGRLAVQGDRAAAAVLTELDLPADETLAIVPRSLLLGIDCSGVYELADGRLAVQGGRADAALLAELNLPPYETLAVVPRRALLEV